MHKKSFMLTLVACSLTLSQTHAAEDGSRRHRAEQTRSRQQRNNIFFACCCKRACPSQAPGWFESAAQIGNAFYDFVDYYTFQVYGVSSERE